MRGARHGVDARPVVVGLGGRGGGGFRVESNGINVIVDEDRRGRPRQLFWPWFGANVSVLGLSYGAYALDFGISFWQALTAGMVGVVASFLLCGFVALAGKRGSAPTMVLSRAAFGVRGNRLPAVISWLLTVGWETVLTVTATLATSTVFEQLGWGGGPATQAVALAVIASLVVTSGVLGFDVVMRLQTLITMVTAVLTVVFIVLVAPTVNWDAVRAVPPGPPQQVVGAVVFLVTGFGLGWVNVAADYSRYLPRTASSRGVVGWTAFGGALAPVVLLGFGLLLASSSTTFSTNVGTDPVGTLAMAVPTWFLVPFALVAVLGLIGGAVLDIYSSGLALIAAGVRVPRPVAALIDGVIMAAGTAYVVFVGGDFLPQFTAFLITLGVPVAAWCGVILADIARRRHDYDEYDLYRPAGRYGDVRLFPIAVVLAATGIGWGLVTNTAWQGYLLGPFGLGGPGGPWRAANLGVLAAIATAFVATFVADGTRFGAPDRRAR
jgi:nucleobase:cation symporter-1, NCS1 family